MKKFTLTAIFLTFSFVVTVFAQNGIISGTVKDSNGEILIGANVILKGTSIGTATDSKGEFALRRLRDGIYRLEISMLGYSKFISEDLRVEGNTIKLDVILNPYQSSIRPGSSFRRKT